MRFSTYIKAVKRCILDTKLRDANSNTIQIAVVTRVREMNTVGPKREFDLRNSESGHDFVTFVNGKTAQPAQNR